MPRCRFSPASPRLRLQTFAQGACAFADKVHKVRVVDGTGNLRLVDTARPPGGKERDVDTIIVDVGPGNFEQILAVPYGRPVLVDGRLFQVVVSEAEARVTASPYEGPTGLLRVGKPFWTARLRTADTAFDVCGGPDPLPLPPGAYEFVAFTEWPSADRSKPANILVVRRQWTDHAGFASTPAPPFQVVAGQTTDVAVGSP
ncbi:MAG: hypothetical protein IMZ55_17960, partial [Acidobacteria bacterium]|nr:hypothetical protein [Acidobacteriota bacterium]